MSNNSKRELTSDSTSWMERAKTTNNSEVVAAGAEEGGLDPDLFLKALQRRLWLVVLSMVVGIVGGAALNRTRTSSYAGNFRIVVEPVTAEAQVAAAIINGDRASVEERDLGSAQFSKTTLDYPTQIQLLLSDKILSPVAKQLSTQYPKISYETLKSSLNINRLKDPA